MLIEFINGLKTYLKAEVPELKGCDEYKGEFDNGSDIKWNIPKHPYCFVDFTGDGYERLGADGASIGDFLNINLIAVDKATEAKSIYGTVEKIRDACNGKTFTVTIELVKFSIGLTLRQEGISKLGYYLGYAHYAIPLKVEIETD